MILLEVILLEVILLEVILLFLFLTVPYVVSTRATRNKKYANTDDGQQLSVGTVQQQGVCLYCP